MLNAQAVGIDLGTTYSCIAHLNEHGEPVTLPNQEGELSTPSVVFFDHGEVVVGTEALRNAIVAPGRVVQNAKRFVGDPKHRWTVDGKLYTPVDISSLILKKLIDAAKDQIGEIDRAVITVPAQFSELQRQATVEAGMRAGLKHVDMINEPVAAALCYVLGSEGLWFTELADEQRILVYDLGGGTFDLSLVKYQQNEVRVIASGGDLNLGGIDWNSTLENAIANQFAKEFDDDPRSDAESLQFLSIEVENAKRSLSVRPRAALTCQHGGNRKTYQVEQTQFQKLTASLVDKTAEITMEMLKNNDLGWAHVDAILTTGGSSRMPMIRNKLTEIGGRTLNTSLSPDQSIAHGATYYAGMLLTNSEFAKSILNDEAAARLSQIRQRSVNARALGVLVKDVKSRKRFPYYLIQANTALPTSVTQHFGTVVPNQKRVHVHIVESGTASDQHYVELGACVIDDLPKNLPTGAEVAVTIHYDEQARVHVSAKDVTSGKEATTEIVREESVALADIVEDEAAKTTGPTEWDSSAMTEGKPKTAPTAKKAASPPQKRAGGKKKPSSAAKASSNRNLDSASMPIPLCNDCGEPLDSRGRCPACGGGVQKKGPQRRGNSLPPVNDSEIMELKPKRRAASKAAKQSGKKKPGVKPLPVPPELDKSPRKKAKQKPKKRSSKPPEAEGEEEFWELVD